MPIGLSTLHQMQAQLSEARPPVNAGMMVRASLEDVGFGEFRRHFARNLLEKPSQAIAVFALRACINDVEGEKKIPIVDIGQECGEPPPIELAFR